MVTLKERHIGKQSYYYLEHSIRDGANMRKKEIYLGKSIPKDIENLKRQFILDLKKDRWYPLFDRIKANFSKELKSMPHSAKEKNLESFAVRFTYDTQRIEGSTLTLRETADLLERGIAPNRPMRDIREAEAHKWVFDEMLDSEKGLSLQLVLYWHKRLFEESKPDIAGRIRSHQVIISGSKFIPPFPSEIYPLLKEFFSWYDRNKAAINPVELAALAHVKFVTIHPFADGNGRVSRLIMNFVLAKHKLPLLDIHYENRGGYYTALERAHLKRDDEIFVRWFFRRYVKEYRKYIK